MTFYEKKDNRIQSDKSENKVGSSFFALDLFWLLIKGLLIILISYICFYLIESFTHNPFEMAFGMQLFNAAFFFLYYLFWFGITGHGNTAAILSSLTAILIGYANYSIILFRDSPILPWDLLSIRTAISVSGNYNFKMPENIWVPLLLTIFVFAITSITKLRLKKKKSRALLATISLIFLLVYGGLLQNPAFTESMHFNETLFTPGYLYKQNGFIPSFLMNLRYLRIEKPASYSPDQVVELADHIESANEGGEPGSSVDPAKLGQKPNLLVIMNETFSDPSILSELKTNEDYMPYFRSLTKNTIRGDLYVSVIGGNTATTEFEFLTGDSMAFLPNGSVAYQQYIHDDHPALPSILKELGYQTIAMHPYPGAGWDRDEVYDCFGFEKTLFINDFKHREYIRAYISDRSVYQEMIDAYEQKSDKQPLFCFAVTMQNHGGYGVQYENFTPTIKVLNEGHNFTLTETFLSLIKESDKALKELIDYFKQADEPTLILFFGDHQPHDQSVAGLLSENSYGFDETEMLWNRYRVPFIIWANYDIDEQKDVITSANFLSALLLETAGLPLTDYQLFLKEVSQEMPVMTANFFMDASGNHFMYAEANEDQAALLKTYEILQYNHLFDKENRLQSLFEFKPGFNAQ